MHSTLEGLGVEKPGFLSVTLYFILYMSKECSAE
jgi:hypothetical protein